MKQLIITLLIASSFSSINAQYGVYKTYEDYQNGKLIEYSESGARISIRFNKFTLTFQDEKGETVKYKLGEENIWGYQFGPRLFRLDEKNEPWLITEFGDLVVYLYHTSVAYPQGDKIVYKFNPAAPMKVSIGKNGKMEKLTKDYLLSVFKDDPETLAALKKVKSKPAALFEFLLNG